MMGTCFDSQKAPTSYCPLKTMSSAFGRMTPKLISHNFFYENKQFSTRNNNQISFFRISSNLSISFPSVSWSVFLCVCFLFVLVCLLLLFLCVWVFVFFFFWLVGCWWCLLFFFFSLADRGIGCSWDCSSNSYLRYFGVLY